jgi:anti-sigma B factor antagonist
MDFEIESASGGGLKIAGDMTVYSAGDLKTALLAQTIVGQQTLDLDLSQVREFDTAGLQLLLMLKRRTQGRLRIVSCSHAVRGALSLCHQHALVADETGKSEAE